VKRAIRVFVNSAQSCGACGGAITAATSFIADTGVLCATCFARWEAEQRVAQSAKTATDEVQLRRASRLAWLHAVNWPVALLLLAGWVTMPGWLVSSLVAAVFVVSFAMSLRSRVAFRVALVLDTGGALAFLVVSVSELRDARLLFLLFPVVFAWWLGFLIWRARATFLAPSRLEPRK
jgi:hypothetical protein